MDRLHITGGEPVHSGEIRVTTLLEVVVAIAAVVGLQLVLAAILRATEGDSDDRNPG